MGSERVAVSGSHGFVGDALVERLVQYDQDIVLVGRQHFKGINADRYYDLATLGNRYGQDMPQRIYQANIMRLADFLFATHFEDYQSFVVTSSLAVKLPNQTFYSRSKKAAEEFAIQYADQYKKPVVILRLGSVTGVGEQEEHLIPKLIDSCMNGTKMPFVAEPTHDFVDIRDVVDAFLIAAENAKEYRGHIFEVGLGVAVTNQEVRDVVERVTGKKANIEKVENMRSYDSLDWRANPFDLQTIGWEPKYTLEDSVRSMVTNYVERTNTGNI